MAKSLALGARHHGGSSPRGTTNIHPDGVTVAALVLGTNDFGRESSSLSWGTIYIFIIWYIFITT